jgi:hypothetical protein
VRRDEAERVSKCALLLLLLQLLLLVLLVVCVQKYECVWDVCLFACLFVGWQKLWQPDSIDGGQA